MRTTLITTLCILTFAWNAFKLYNSYGAYSKSDKMAEVLPTVFEEVQDQMSAQQDLGEKEQAEVDKMLGEIQKSFSASNVKISSIVNMLSALLLIAGAALMWDGKKRGFYIYLAGGAVGVLAPVFIFGGVMGISIGFMSLITAAIFSGLYAIDLNKLV
jgi:uncharacterized membrane protein